MTDTITGNGQPQKAFELARPKTEEDKRRDAARQMMPELRRESSQKRIPVGAKWLFCQMSDDSFKFDFGGDGFGSLVTTIKQIAARYGHDRESLAKWLDALVKRELIWIEQEHPWSIIHITGLVPPPEHRATMVQRAKARQNAVRNSRVASTVTPDFDATEGDSTRKAQQIHTLRRQMPSRCVDSTDTPCGRMPHEVSEDATRNSGRMPHRGGVEPAQGDGRCHTGVPVDATQRVENPRIGPHENSASEPVSAPLEDTPEGKRVETEGTYAGTRVVPALAARGGIPEAEEVAAHEAMRIDKPRSKGKRGMAGPTKPGEDEFLELCSQVLGKAEMDRNGGLWRIRYRENPEKAGRCVQDVRSRLAENPKAAKKSPAAMATDNWRRFA